MRKLVRGGEVVALFVLFFLVVRIGIYIGFTEYVVVLVKVELPLLLVSLTLSRNVSAGPTPIKLSINLPKTHLGIMRIRDALLISLVFFVLNLRIHLHDLH